MKNCTVEGAAIVVHILMLKEDTFNIARFHVLFKDKTSNSHRADAPNKGSRGAECCRLT